MLFKIRKRYEQMGNHGSWVQWELYSHFLKITDNDFLRAKRQAEAAWRCISGDYSR